jgi:hypothetical protein
MLLALSLRDFFEDVRDALDDWIDERDGFVARGLLLVYLAYGLVRHVLDPMYRSWFGGITLGFHEMGHILFIPFGRTMTIAGGSIMQLLVPLAAALYLLVKQRDWFGFVVGLSWLSFSGFELATYIGDAAREALPLVSFGGGYHHDWSMLLTQWHLLNQCDAIALGVRIVAGGIGLGAVALGGYIVVRIGRRRLFSS